MKYLSQQKVIFFVCGCFNAVIFFDENFLKLLAKEYCSFKWVFIYNICLLLQETAKEKCKQNNSIFYQRGRNEAHFQFQ